MYFHNKINTILNPYMCEEVEMFVPRVIKMYILLLIF